MTDVIDRLAAAGLKIKPLKWEDDGRGGFYAHGIDRTYAVFPLALDPQYWGSVPVSQPEIVPGKVMDALNAKHEARILAALTEARHD